MKKQKTEKIEAEKENVERAEGEDRKNKIKARISKEKIETVKKLVDSLKENKTLIIASIKNLPSRQFQEIRKKLRKDVKIMVVKKRVFQKALESEDREKLEKLKNYIQEDSSILFSKLDCFELAALLAENKNPIKAKPGQVAVEDIEVEAGPTDLMPGPAISEFGNLGIKVAVEEGKIAIKEKKVIAKKDEKISDSAAAIMAKLDIKPFDIGLDPIVLYDLENNKIYENIKIDKKKAVENLKIGFAKSLGFAQKIAYYCKETISYLLGKANNEGKIIQKLENSKEAESEEKEKIKNNEGKAEKEETKNNENADDKTEEEKEEKPSEKSENKKQEKEDNKEEKNIENSEDKNDIQNKSSQEEKP